jgi:hypothetical protein
MSFTRSAQPVYAMKRRTADKYTACAAQCRSGTLVTTSPAMNAKEAWRGCLHYLRTETDFVDTKALHRLNTAYCPQDKTAEMCECGAPATWHNNFCSNQTARFGRFLCADCTAELYMSIALSDGDLGRVSSA